MDPLNAPLPPWHVTGLLEGLACFACARNGRSVQPSLDVTLPAGEHELLRRLQAALGGRLVRGGRTLRVTRTEDLLRVVEHLERFAPQGAARRAAVAIWSEIVRARAARGRRPHAEALAGLVDELRASQPRRRGRHASPEVDADPRGE